MQDDMIETLKNLAEGRMRGSDWHKWLKDSEVTLKSVLTPGSYLRLKFHPLVEAKSILETVKVAFTPSDALEWLDVDSQSGKCRFCGERIARNQGGWAWCPKGCFRVVV